MKEEEILTLFKDFGGRLVIQIEMHEDGADTFLVSEVLERAIVEELRKHDFRGAVKIIKSCVR